MDSRPYSRPWRSYLSKASPSEGAPTSARFLSVIGPIDLPSLLAACLSATLDITAARTAATQTHLDQPCQDGEGAGHPHEREHLRSNSRLDVDICLADEDVAQDDEHGGAERRGHRDDECVEEAEDGDREGRPSRVQR